MTASKVLFYTLCVACLFEENPLTSFRDTVIFVSSPVSIFACNFWGKFPELKIEVFPRLSMSLLETNIASGQAYGMVYNLITGEPQHRSSNKMSFSLNI